MKIRGFLVLLLLAMVIVYFLYFAKTAGKGSLQTDIDQFARTKIELTKVNLATLEQIIVGFIGSQGRLPADLNELRRMQPMMAGVQDAWGHNFKYERLSDSEFRLTSAGPDGALGTEDDIIREY